jgi:hypothetical protein
VTAIEEDTVTDTAEDRSVDYGALGLVANPFPLWSDEPGDDAYWVRVVTHAASNALLSACVKAAAPERSRPVMLTMTEDIPDFFPTGALNDFLYRSAHDPALRMMALNIHLEMMQLGTIRGPLTEFAELLAAVDFPRTAGEYFARMLREPDLGLPESSVVTMEQIEEAAALFAAEPATTTERFFGARRAGDGISGVVLEEDALQATYVRQLADSTDLEAESPEGEGADMPEYDEAPVPLRGAEESDADADQDDAEEPQASPDEALREYLIACVKADLSPTIARALRAYRSYGATIVAQEIKVTKAPRRTLTAVLRFMSARFGTVVAIFNNFDPWPRLEPEARRDVLLALAELRLIVGEAGVLGVALVEGQAPELEEQFAGGVKVRWGFEEVASLQHGEKVFEEETVQRWLDAASLDEASAFRADGPQLSRLIEACDGDMIAFARMAEAAFRSSAQRGASELDEAALADGLAAAGGESDA